LALVLVLVDMSSVEGSSHKKRQIDDDLPFPPSQSLHEETANLVERNP
jgi:hypothetical protein